jgi:hypothetical protein
MPVRPRRRDRVEQVQVHPLVDNAEEPESRMRNRGLVLGVGLPLTRRTEVWNVDAAWERIRTPVTLALRFV